MIWSSRSEGGATTRLGRRVVAPLAPSQQATSLGTGGPPGLCPSLAVPLF